VKTLALLAAICVAACTPASTPDAGPPPEPPATVIYGELVEAGCLAYDDAGDGLNAITTEHASHDTPWLECLFLEAGATISSCAVPCK
jgi:hypothetical protein